MKKKIFSFVLLLLVISIPAGVFSQTGQLVQNFTAKWINSVPWFGYTNSAQAKFKTYLDSCSELGCTVRILEQEDIPYVDNAAFFDWIADPQEKLPTPDSIRITSKWVSKDPQTLPIVFLTVNLLQKSLGGGYFSGGRDISSTWKTYTWKITYPEMSSFEGFSVGVAIGQSNSIMKAVIAIKAIEFWRNGICYYQYLFKPDTAVSTENTPTVPTGFALGQNYPNPFNPSTRIQVTIPEPGNYRLSVFNTLGQEVTVLASEQLSTGKYEFIFNAATLPSGTYFYRLTGRNVSITKKMILLK